MPHDSNFQINSTAKKWSKNFTSSTSSSRVGILIVQNCPQIIVSNENEDCFNGIKSFVKGNEWPSNITLQSHPPQFEDVAQMKYLNIFLLLAS